MKVARLLVCVLVTAISTVSSVYADNTTPVVVPTAAPVVVPTDVPIAQPTQAPPLTEPSPIVVAPEHSTPVVQVSGPQSSATSPPAIQPTSVYESTPPTPIASLAPIVTRSGNAIATPVHQSTGPVASAPQSESSIAPSTNVTASSSSTSYDYTSVPTSAQAPAQLHCSRQFPRAAGPFMVSPYGGWTELFSYVDHDLPDYSVDGKIVLANGLAVTASNGQESDMFPAYWSPTLRQYINYDGHNGYDFGLSYQPILAAASGTVEYAGWNGADASIGYGQMVLINHHNGYVTLYGHLSSLEVQKGDKVQAGQQIGISGSTGHSSGPHLHFSVFHNCQVTDPYGWSGHGTDPLKTFDKENAEYLWLPGSDPLIVNPLPDWPTYPVGLQLPKSLSHQRVHQVSQLPPADRLVLLALPAPAGENNASAALSLTRTEQAMTSELQTLTPLLSELQRQGLVSSFQAIPAAAAIWVRGSASAAQLEALPGVASLSGVEPRDLEAAQRGVAHAVLIQIGKQQLQSLWPMGFRSALQEWRPLMTVMENRPLVAGFTMPGAHVTLSLSHKGNPMGTADAVADQTSGGFVVTMHDPAGTPVSARTGDRVSITSGGRSSACTIRPLHLKAQSRTFSGGGPGNTSVAFQYVAAKTGVVTDVASTGSSGLFSGHVRTSMSAGDTIVASIGNDAGNQEAVSASVPGFDIQAGTGLVHGWMGSKSANLVVYRAGKVVRAVPLRSAAGGEFQTELNTSGKAFTIAAGDKLVMAGSHFTHTLVVPALGARVAGSNTKIGVTAPSNNDVHVTYVSTRGKVWTRSGYSSSIGRTSFVLPGQGLQQGDSVTLNSTLSSGDHIHSTLENRAVHIHAGSALVTGTIRPGAVISIRALDAHKHTVGGLVAGSDPIHGKFSGRLRDTLGRQMRFAAVKELLVREDATTFTVKTPAFSLRLGRGLARGSGPAHRTVYVRLGSVGGTPESQTLQTGDAGAFTVSLPNVHFVAARLDLSNGFTLERRAVAHSCKTARKCSTGNVR